MPNPPDLPKRESTDDGNAMLAQFEQHRDRLRRMVRLRMDPRLRCRLDISDVVQDVYLEASRRLRDGERDQRLPVLLWLRLLTGQKLADAHRRHLGAGARDVRREAQLRTLWSSDTRLVADRLSGTLTSPSAAVARDELSQRLHAALEGLDTIDREVLVLRHFEQLTNREVAAELELLPSAASKRYLRALERLRRVFDSAASG